MQRSQYPSRKHELRERFGSHSNSSRHSVDKEPNVDATVGDARRRVSAGILLGMVVASALAIGFPTALKSPNDAPAPVEENIQPEFALPLENNES